MIDQCTGEIYCLCDDCYAIFKLQSLEMAIEEFLDDLPDEFLGLRFRLVQTLKRLRLHIKSYREKPYAQSQEKG